MVVKMTSEKKSYTSSFKLKVVETAEKNARHLKS